MIKSKSIIVTAVKNAKTDQQWKPKDNKLFTLTSINLNSNLKQGLSAQKQQKTLSKNDFSSLSPRCIVEEFDRLTRNNQKVTFAGVGLQHTIYFKQYMTYHKEKIDPKKRLAMAYLNSIKANNKVSEHAKSVNRIKRQMIRVSNDPAVMISLEEDLDNAYSKVNKDMRRATAYSRSDRSFF